MRLTLAALFEANEPIGRLQQLFTRFPAGSRPPAGQQLLGVVDEFGGLAATAQQRYFGNEPVASRQDAGFPRAGCPLRRATRIRCDKR